MEDSPKQPPLSQSLAAVFGDPAHPQPASINSVLVLMEGRGIFLVNILLALPFMIPVAVPGSSVVLGLIIVLLNLSYAFGFRPRLPRFLGERPLPATVQKALLGSGVGVLRWIERWIKPRRTAWMTWRTAQFFNSSLILLLAALMALPLPISVLTNTLPACGIILISASMVEADGNLILVGYAMTGVTLICFVFGGDLLAKAIGHGWTSLEHWLALP